MRIVRILLFVLLTTCVQADDSEKLSAILAAAAEQSGVATIPPGDYELDGTKPIRIDSRLTVSAYGARFHLPRTLGDKSRIVLFTGTDVS